MTIQFAKITMAIGVALFLGAISASAQLHSRLVADIPFDFYVNGQKFQSGTYEVTSANPQAGQATLILRRKENPAAGSIVMLMPMVLTKENSRPSPQLTFNRYGSIYFLREVQNSAENYDARAGRSKEERTIGRQFGQPKQENIALSKQR